MRFGAVVMLAVSGILLMSGAAFATSWDPSLTDEDVALFLPVGDPVACGSWKAHFNNYVGATNVDFIQARARGTTVGFENPGIKNITATTNANVNQSASWHQVFDNGSIVAAAGNSQLAPWNGTIAFDLFFNDTSAPTPPSGSYVYLDLQAWGMTTDINGVKKESLLTNQTFRYGLVEGSTTSYTWYAKAWDSQTHASFWVASSAGSYFGNVYEASKSLAPAGEWNASAPVPEPLTMLGVFGSVAGIGAYIRKRRVA